MKKVLSKDSFKNTRLKFFYFSSLIENTANFISLNRKLNWTDCHLLVLTRRLERKSIDYWILLPYDQTDNDSNEMILLKLTDRDNLLHCLSYQENYESIHATDVNHQLTTINLIDELSTKADDLINEAFDGLGDAIKFNPLNCVSGRIDAQVIIHVFLIKFCDYF